MQLALLLSLALSVYSILAYVSFRQDASAYIPYKTAWVSETTTADHSGLSFGSSTQLGDFSWSVAALKVMNPEEL